MGKISLLYCNKLIVCHLCNFIHLKSHLALNQVRDTVIVLYWILMSVDWTQVPCCLLELIPVTDDWDCVVTLGFSLELNWSGKSDWYLCRDHCTIMFFLVEKMFWDMALSNFDILARTSNVMKFSFSAQQGVRIYCKVPMCRILGVSISRNWVHSP